LLRTARATDDRRSRWISRLVARRDGRRSREGPRPGYRAVQTVGSIGLANFAVTLSFEACNQSIYGRIGIWTSHFVIIIFTTLLAMALGHVVQQRQERSRRRVEKDFRSQDLIRQRMERRLQHSEDQMAMAIDASKIGFSNWIASATNACGPTGSAPVRDLT